MEGGGRGAGGFMDDYCDTELCLSPAGGGRRLARNNTAKRVEPGLNGGAAAGNAVRPEQQVTMFYGGRMCVCDVTEIQARAIICMAKREMDDMMAAAKKKMRKMEAEQEDDEPTSLIPRLMTAADPQLLNPGLSMKNSLQRFLQKRKARASLGPDQQYTCSS